MLSRLILLALVSQTVFAAPYYRFWRGTKLSGLDEEGFRKGLNQVFVPKTVEVGKGKGLLSYLPVLSPRRSSRPAGLPDEVALVTYSSEDSYQRIRSTPAGKAYSDLHWKYFSKDESRSLVPTRFDESIKNDAAYDVLYSDKDWQGGHATYRLSSVKGDIETLESYLRTAREKSKSLGLLSYIVVVTKNYLYEYQLWDSPNAYRSAYEENSPLGRMSRSLLELIHDDQLKRVEPGNADLQFGMGISAAFDQDSPQQCQGPTKTE